MSPAEEAASNALAAMKGMGIVYGLFGLLSLVDVERADRLRVDVGQVLETVAALGLELVDNAIYHTDALHELYRERGAGGGRV